MITAGLAGRPGGVRRLGRAVRGAALSGACLAGVAAVGAVVSSRATYPRPRQDARGRPAAPPAPAGRIVVAVVLGPRGSVGTDALAPYEVFARSPAFFVYTVSPGRAASVLSGGLALVPEHSLEDVDAGSVPEPDVVVVPAVVNPAGQELAPLRDWITRHAGRGAHILGVCAGSALLAAAGLLDGRRATSHWSNIASLRRKHPHVDWVRGQRYVVDGSITTTGGVTSGIFGALRLIGQLAGTAEAERVGRELAYPGWHLGTPADMPAQQVALGDLSYALIAAFPWFRPTVGIGLVSGVGEIDAAAAFDIYAGNSHAARAVPIAAGSTVTTRHGLQLLARPAGPGAPRVDRLAALTIAAVIGAGFLPAAARRHRP